EEAARGLGWPLGTVKGRLARARDLLRDRLARRGLALSAGGLAAALAAGSAPAAVPPVLLGLTLRGALAFPARGAVPAGAASARAVALAQEAFQPRTAPRRGSVLGLLGAGLLAYSLAAGPPPQGQRADPPPSLPGQADAGRPGTDRHGDPLPPGALARL